MKRKYIFAFALLTFSLSGIAQTPATQNTTDSRNGSTGAGDKSGQADGTQGTLNGSPPGTSAARMGGQTGDEAGSGAFDTMDTNHHGYLMASDVKSNKHLSQRFKSCDMNHDGQLSRDEYNACTKTQSP